MRQRKQLARTYAAGERRLSGFPGGHFSITDADVARMPGIRRNRRAAHSSFGSLRGYTAVTSEERLPRRPVLTTMARAVVKDTANLESNTLPPSWPLSRRLTRSGAIPISKAKPPSMLPVIDRLNAQEDRDIPTEVGQGGQERPVEKKIKMLPSVPSFEATLQADMFAATVLKPKPLFHDNQRSVSAGTMAHRSQRQQHEGNGSSMDSELLRARLPRSTSLCSQKSGLAPTMPMPPLPSNILPSKRFHTIKSPAGSSMRTSENSLFSGYTSILDGIASRPFSQVETDLTSTSVASPVPLEFRPEGLGIFTADSTTWDPRDYRESSRTVHQVKTARVCAQPGSQKPLRASIVGSLPRSESSGLSMSLLDHGPSRDVSNTSLNKDQALLIRKSTLRVPKTTDCKTTRQRGLSPASPLRNISACNNYEETKEKRLSTSILQVVSGNNSGPLYDRQSKRSSSWSRNATQCDTATLSTQASIETRVLHQADDQSSLRISNILLAPVPLGLPVARERTKSQPSNAFALHPSLDLSKNDFFLPGPPPCVDFDPQINSKLFAKASHHRSFTVYSPTLSMVNLYDSSTDEPSEPGMSVFGEDLSVKPPSGANPNRHRTIFPTQSNVIGLSFSPDPELAPESPCSDLHLDRSSPSTNLRSSFLFPMPPPSRRQHPYRRRSPSNSPIRGPRTPPTRRSYSRRISKATHHHPGGDLRKSVAALRRMNSEAAVGLHPKQHKRYLSIGDTGSMVFVDEPSLQNLLENTEVRGEGTTGSVVIPGDISGDSTEMRTGGTVTPIRKGLVELWGTPGSLYDTKGFLRD